MRAYAHSKTEKVKFKKDIPLIPKQEEHINELFKPPMQWGLRGDPHLWQQLKIAYSNAVGIDTLEAFTKFLHQVFQKHTKHLPQKEQNYFVADFDTGSMSSGLVCSDFWIEKGFPLLEKRFRRLLS